MIGINFELDRNSFNDIAININSSRTRISKKLKDMIEDTAQELINDITKHILMDDLGLEELAPSTIKKKEKTAPAFANKPWVESRTFMDGLTFWWEGYGEKGKEKKVAIGVPEDEMRTGSNGRKIRVADYIEINESIRPLMQLSMNRFLESGKPEKFMDKYFGDED